jgi:adenine-specific DNA-methyltransferase
MRKSGAHQQVLFDDLPGAFPRTRYQGSKAKLVEWIWEQIRDLDFQTCLDAFGGTGAVAYRLKQAGKQVTYNDLLRFNYYFGLALIENQRVRLGREEVHWLLTRHRDVPSSSFIQDSFKDTYFTDGENSWIDQTIGNIRRLSDPYKFALAFFALCQACIIKRPYNLFHRKNLYIREAEVERSFGNKATWDRPFEDWFKQFIDEANRAVFDNGQKNVALNLDALAAPGDFDLVYIDTPYISKRGVAVDYRDFYHFLEGLTMYDEWDEHIDRKSKHHRLRPLPNEWTDKKSIYAAFNRLFNRFQDGIIVVSYRSDGIPSAFEIASLLKKYKRNVNIENYGRYQYALSASGESKEILLIGA